MARTRDVYTGRVHGRVRAVHTAVYATRIRPRARVYVSTCTRAVYTAVLHRRVTRPCTGYLHGRKRPKTAVCTAVTWPSTRPYTAVYMAAHGRVTFRVYGRVRAVSACVHGSVRAVCTAVFRRVHWPCTLPFSAVYIARTRPCSGPCTRPLHGRVQGPYGPCIRQGGPPGHAHVPRRYATAVYGTTCTRPCTWHVTAVYTAHGRNVLSRRVYTAV